MARESRSKFHYIGSPLSARMSFTLLHCLLSFVTVTSSAHQRFLCCVISSSAAISVPHSVRVRRYYGPRGVVDRHLVTVPQGVVGDRLPWGGEGQGGGRVQKRMKESQREQRRAAGGGLCSLKHMSLYNLVMELGSIFTPHPPRVSAGEQP